METQNKIASLIVPTYNRSELLDLTLSSIKDQTLNNRLFEVLVVDDGSSDDSQSVVDGYRDSLDIKYFYQEDRGYRVASARNIGINNSIGDVVIFVDSGVILGSDCIKEHLASHSSSPSDMAVVGYVYGLHRTELEDTMLPDLVHRLGADGTIKHLSEKSMCLDSREQVYKICDSDLNELPAPWALFWTGNVSAKRERILEAGSFDSNYDHQWGMEDIDLGYQLYLNKLGFCVNRHAAGIHYPHANDKEAKLRQEHINKLYFNSKYKSMETSALMGLTTVTLNLHLAEKMKYIRS
jgi:glycosyltransferase involved in cell wall biosynthesis